MIAISATDSSVKGVASGGVSKGVYRVSGKGAAGAVPGTGTRRTNASPMRAANGGVPNGVYSAWKGAGA